MRDFSNWIRALVISEAKLCVSVSDRVDGYGGVYCDWCSLHESYNLFNYAQRLKVIRRKQQNVFLNRKMAESTLCVCVFVP